MSAWSGTGAQVDRVMQDTIHHHPPYHQVNQLVGGLEHDFYDFLYIENVIIPIDFHMFQRGGSTTYQMYNIYNYIHI